ncbi:homoserine O-acetyltransferase [Phaeosphaeria sp. MPI-PUGE-AT-0046c]|nr:homoserine O-acetyltransferase [Phaeosphaeria sp. MPI-PUGE-AT-0046c]
MYLTSPSPHQTKTNTEAFEMSAHGSHVKLQHEVEQAAPILQSFYARLVPNKKIATLSRFTLESGATIERAEVAYSTFGALNSNGNNVLVVCHALTGSSDVADWWQPLLGAGKALDPTRYFIFCANVLGSPYGSSSPLTIDPLTRVRYGPTFPDTTIRDDVQIQKLILDALQVKSVAAVIGSSMGGMHALEWPLCTGPGYVKNIITIATSVYQGAWGISWGESQKQAIYADGIFDGGWYDPTPTGQPRNGLGLARMIGMLTYRSFDSFEARFGRDFKYNNERTMDMVAAARMAEAPLTRPTSENYPSSPKIYLAQSYLRYQAAKFLNRFDANCYLHLMNKIDTHNVTRDRGSFDASCRTPDVETLEKVLSTMPTGALVVGVQDDLLFPLSQQATIAACLPGAKLVTLISSDGHDGFLIEFEQLNSIITKYLQERYTWY